MDLIFIVLIIALDTILCVIEIPKMRKENQRKELWTFSILLGIGTLLALAKGLDMEIPNPSDIVMTIYNPIVASMKAVFDKGEK